jgi:hypothetical protein
MLVVLYASLGIGENTERLGFEGCTGPKFAAAELMNSVPATTVIRSAEMKAAANVCFFTVSPNNNRVSLRLKRFRQRFLTKTAST